MRYYTVKALVTTDGTETRDMRGFDTIDEALARFHTDLAKVVNVEGTISVMMSIIDSASNKLKSEVWESAETEESLSVD